MEHSRRKDFDFEIAPETYLFGLQFVRLAAVGAFVQLDCVLVHAPDTHDLIVALVAFAWHTSEHSLLGFSLPNLLDGFLPLVSFDFLFVMFSKFNFSTEYTVYFLLDFIDLLEESFCLFVRRHILVTSVVQVSIDFFSQLGWHRVHHFLFLLGVHSTNFAKV